MFKDINDNNQFFKINVKRIEKNVNINNRNYVRDLYTLDEDSLSNLFSDYCIEFDKNKYLIDEYPISSEEQQKAFDDFVNNYIIIPYDNNKSSSSDIEGLIRQAFEKKCKSKKQYPYSPEAVQEFENFFNKEAMVVRPYCFYNKGFLVCCDCRFLEGKYLIPRLDVSIIPKIVQSAGTGRNAMF